MRRLVLLAACAELAQAQLLPRCQTDVSGNRICAGVQTGTGICSRSIGIGGCCSGPGGPCYDTVVEKIAPDGIVPEGSPALLVEPVTVAFRKDLEFVQARVVYAGAAPGMIAGVARIEVELPPAGAGALPLSSPFATIGERAFHLTLHVR